AIREKVFGAQNRFTAFGRADLAALMITRNRAAAAEPILAGALAAIAAADGADSPLLARPLYQLGRAQRLQRKNVEAEATLRRTLDAMRRGWDPNDELVGWTWQQLAATQFDRGRRV